MAVESPGPFNAWVDRLAERTDIDIKDFETFLEAIRRRHDFFHEMGCRLSDHGVETIYAEEYSDTDIERHLPADPPRETNCGPRKSSSSSRRCSTSSP